MLATRVASRIASPKGLLRDFQCLWRGALSHHWCGGGESKDVGTGGTGGGDLAGSEGWRRSNLGKVFAY
jgi:hypothetical protein